MKYTKLSVIRSHLHPSVIFIAEAGAYLSGAPSALPTKVRRGWKWLAAANVLVYYSTKLVTPVKIFIVRGQ
jgi:hypothetical protein